MLENVYVLVLLHYDEFPIILAYPCVLCMFLLCFSFAMITIGGSRWEYFWR